MDRRPYDQWKARGQITSIQRARQRAKGILETHTPPPLPQEAALKAILEESTRQRPQGDPDG
jgi:trimethylamine:corrinoid methyltransferase-like protein